jgi:isoquinoline 1-oxidoreductase beta subunit
MLLDNAARHWGVLVDELRTEPSAVVHNKSGRRLSYGEIAAFAVIPENAPEIKPEQLKKPSEFRLIGYDTTRVELPTKVNGSATYSIDVQVPGMIYGAVLRAPVEGATPDKFDEAKAKAVAGVIDVVKLPYGIGVLAQVPWAAFEATDAIAATTSWIHDGRAWGFDSDKGIEKFAAAARDPKAKVTVWSEQGDAAAELIKVASVMEADYRCDYACHAQMEPLNATAAVSVAGDSVEIWCGAQSQTWAVETAAKALGINRDKVKLNYLLLGGSFGRRADRTQDFIVDAVLLSKAAKRPVKVMWTREDDLHNGHFRPLTVDHVTAGFDAAGKLVAWHHRVAGDRALPYQDPVRYQAAGKDYVLMAGVDLKGYDIPHQLADQVLEDTGVRTSTGLRSTSSQRRCSSTKLRESGVDPIAYRLQLLKDDPRGRTVVERVAKTADWGRKLDGRGLGFAYISYSDSLLGGIAEVSADRKTGVISVHHFWCALDCGIEVHPDNVMAQIEGGIVYGLGMSLMERISVKDGAVEQSNFYDYLVPRMNQIPEIHIELIPTDNHPTGVGQMATPLVGPAIANAIAQLTGVQLRHTPMTPERVKKALG